MASSSSDPTSTTTPWTPGNIEQEQEAKEKLDIWPLDTYNAKLLNEVHPRGYKASSNEPHEIYDLIAIGSGAGGLVSSRQVRFSHACVFDLHYLRDIVHLLVSMFYSAHS